MNTHTTSYALKCGAYDCPFAGSHTQAPQPHWRQAVFLKVVIAVTTEDGVSLNPAATYAEGEVWDYSDHLLTEGTIPLASF